MSQWKSIFCKILKLKVIQKLLLLLDLTLPLQILYRILLKLECYLLIGVHTGTTVPWGYRYNGEKYRCQTVLKVAGTFLPVLWLKMPLCWCSRQGGKECRDAGSAGKYIAIASSSGGRHFNCTTIDTNARSSTWKSMKRATLCILHGASPAPPHFSKH